MSNAFTNLHLFEVRFLQIFCHQSQSMQKMTEILILISHENNFFKHAFKSFLKDELLIFLTKKGS